MRPGGEELVDLVEVDGLPVGPADLTPFAGPVSRQLGHWPWWRAADPRRRGLAVACVGLTAVTVLAGTGALLRPTRVESRTATVVGPRPPAGVDAAGCPIVRTCEIRSARRVRELVRSTMPQVQVARSSEVHDVENQHVYRRELYARGPATGITLWMTTQCLPNGQVTTGDAPVARTFGVDTRGVPIVIVERTAVSAATRCSSFVRATFPRAAEDGLGNFTAAVLQLAVSPEALSRE